VRRPIRNAKHSPRPGDSLPTPFAQQESPGTHSAHGFAAPGEGLFLCKEFSMGTPLPPERTLTQLDYVRLTRLASLARPEVIETLETLLEGSDLVPSRAAPATLVTMYTQLLVKDLASDTLDKVTLCYPDDAQPREGFISVFAPLGASLLGLKEGDVARWRTPLGGERMVRVVRILFQPEASGDYTT
jgi:regulator of nucleoside diphosphate kinase